MLNIKNVCKIYRNKDYSQNVLKDINLCIEDQEIISLVGQSGCGKSTY